MCSVCRGRVVRCARVVPEPRARRLPLTSAAKKHNTEHPRQQAAVVDNAHRTAVLSMFHLHPVYPPPYGCAGLGRSLALAWPGHTVPLVRDSIFWWCKPSEMRARLFRADAVRTYVDICFLLTRCARSSGEIAGCPGQQDYCSFQTPKSKPNPKQIGRYGHFGPILGAVVLEVVFLGTGRTETGQIQSQLELRKLLLMFMLHIARRGNYTNVHRVTVRSLPVLFLTKTREHLENMIISYPRIRKIIINSIFSTTLFYCLVGI